jgi:hypothetical protein
MNNTLDDDGNCSTTRKTFKLNETDSSNKKRISSSTIEKDASSSTSKKRVFFSEKNSRVENSINKTMLSKSDKDELSSSFLKDINNFQFINNAPFQPPTKQFVSSHTTVEADDYSVESSQKRLGNISSITNSTSNSNSSNFLSPPISTIYKKNQIPPVKKALVSTTTCDANKLKEKLSKVI